MAEVGKLRLRDGHLIVEGIGGNILAEVEPDDHMTIDDGTGIAGLMQSMLGGSGPLEFEGRISVTWYQTVREERGHIDAEAIEVDDQRPPRPELGTGDA